MDAVKSCKSWLSMAMQVEGQELFDRWKRPKFVRGKEHKSLEICGGNHAKEEFTHIDELSCRFGGPGHSQTGSFFRSGAQQ